MLSALTYLLANRLKFGFFDGNIGSKLSGESPWAKR